MCLIHDKKYLCWTRNKEDLEVVNDIYSWHIMIMWSFWICFICLWSLTPRTKITCTDSHYLRLIVTSTELTFFARFAYKEHEKEVNFKYTIEKWMDLFTSKKLIPKIMDSDWELDLMNVIDVVFPTSVHLWYTLYVMKNVGGKLKLHVNENIQDLVTGMCNQIMYSKRVVGYEQNLPNFVGFVSQTWLSPYNEKFVIVWTN